MQKKSKLNEFIEININNLAAVPSIIYGLLGFIIFLNVFNIPRSSALLGGLVLALMTLPTIIISSRSALKAVPPSYYDGALALGASPIQAAFSVVLPQAIPGIMTGAIIGIAKALGETAPLLIIGMFAFVVQPPERLTDQSSALPVIVYNWASSSHQALQTKSYAAIIVLLVFLIFFNGLATYIRYRTQTKN